MTIVNHRSGAIIDGRPVPYITLHGGGLRILGEILAARAEGRPLPTVHDLCEATGIGSPNGVVFHLKRLMQMGLIKWEADKARTLVATCKVKRTPT